MLKDKWQFPLIETNSFDWKMFHGLNYLIGGITFPLGSFIYFDFIMNQIEAEEIAGWLFSIGSFTFLLADIQEWYHYTPKLVPCLSLCDDSLEAPLTFTDRLKWRLVGFNYFLNIIASVLYFVGSVFFIPQTHEIPNGQLLFLVGSALIMISQLWKMLRTAFQGHDTIINNVKADFWNFLSDFGSFAGGAFYMEGVWLFIKAGAIPLFYTPAVILFCLGGMSFFMSSILLQIKYFFSDKKKKFELQDQNNLEVPLNKESSNTAQQVEQ